MSSMTVAIEGTQKDSVLMAFFKRVDSALERSMKTIIIAITAMTSITMLIQVITRYFFEIAVSGLDEITGHTAVWLYLMGAAYGAYDRSQIKAEMVHLIIKNPRVLGSIRALASLIASVVAGYMVTWSYGYIRWSILKHEVTPTLQYPTVIFQSAILVGAVLMVFYFVRETIDLVRQAVYPEQPSA